MYKITMISFHMRKSSDSFIAIKTYEGYFKITHDPTWLCYKGQRTDISKSDNMTPMISL